MKYRIVQRKNRCNSKVTFAVERLIDFTLDTWVLDRYYDERNEPKMAVFDTVHDAETFIDSQGNPIIQTTVKEIEL